MDGTIAQTVGQAADKGCDGGVTPKEWSIAIVTARRLVRFECHSTSQGRWELLDDLFSLLVRGLANPYWGFYEIRTLLGISDLFRRVPQDVFIHEEPLHVLFQYRFNDV